MKTTQADRLRAELSSLRNSFITYGGCSPADSARMDAIRAELGKLARRRVQARNRRELLYDINGHYGPA